MYRYNGTYKAHEPFDQINFMSRRMVGVHKIVNCLNILNSLRILGRLVKINEAYIFQPIKDIDW